MSAATRVTGSGLALMLALLGASKSSSSVIEQWPLDGETTVVLAEDHRAPLVTLRIEFPAGRWSPWIRETGAWEAFEAQLHDPGGRLRQTADELAVEIRLAVGDRAATLEASFVREDLDAVLDFVRVVLTHPDIDRRELIRRARERKIAWDGSRRQPFFVGRRALGSQLFADGDPRRLAWERPRRDRRDLAKRLEARDLLVRLPGRVVGLAGAVTRDEAGDAAAALLPPALESPPGRLAPDLRALRPAADRRDAVTVRLRGLTQVYFVYGRESPPCTDPAYPALLVADQVLGGHFHSRLAEALRHREGDTYGAWISRDEDVVERPMSLVSFTRTANLDEAARKIERALAEFHERGITDEERVAVIGYLVGRRAFRRQAPDQFLTRFLQERRLGLRTGHLDDLVERASRLSLEEINRQIRAHYDPSSFTRVRVVPEP